jgi:aminoglycoside phosphotransferase family enzyme/predicted kinase
MSPSGPEALVQLLQRLQREVAFSQPAAELVLITTHSSRVLLTGPFAYKFKRPVRYPFLDYSSLEKRRRACLDELQVNRPFAPGLYLTVLALREGPQGHLEWVEAGEKPVEGALEYAVQMRQFEQDQLLARLADAGQLTPGDIDSIARHMAAVHAAAERADLAWGHGQVPEVRRWVMENFSQLEEFTRGESPLSTWLEAMRRWTEDQLKRLGPLIEERARNGFVRACHGDLHLNNMIRQGGDVLFFDAIEFNEELRWIDIQSELAFTLMDLVERGLSAEADQLLNRYLSESGDYAGLPLLRFFVLYRALVRSKVEALRETDPDARRQGLLRSLAMAKAFMEPAARFVVLMHGLSGSGKSTWAARIAARTGAVHLRSDVERKRLAGLEAGADSRSAPGAGLYSQGSSEATYARLAKLSRMVLEAGWPVVVDAAFLLAAQRRPFRELALHLQIPCLLIALDVPLPELRQRVQSRALAQAALPPQQRDPSEADEQVLHYQLGTVQTPEPGEAPFRLTPQTDEAELWKALEALRQTGR